jgi:spore coat protein A, manganese oxidase
MLALSSTPSVSVSARRTPRLLVRGALIVAAYLFAFIMFVGGNPDVTPFLQGAKVLPGPAETGWRDTIMVPPGMDTRIIVRWAPTDKAVGAAASSLSFPFDPSGGGIYGYVWHCHIVDHEDNEMMRPDLVIANPAAARRTFAKGAY